MATAGVENHIVDVPGLQVGHAHDPIVNTGTSVILMDVPATAAVAVAGGGPGTRETDLLSAGMLVNNVDAVVLSGGSAYGLAAADGVAAILGAQGRGFAMTKLPGIPKTPIVPAAILYDLANGGDKAWADTPPYQALGKEALNNAGRKTDLGRLGAGYGARAGQARGGIGSASILTKEGFSVGALAAVNCFGSVYMPGSEAFWAWPYEIAGEFGGQRPETDYDADAEDWGDAKINPALGQNTTIACIATDIALSPSDAQRVADMALAGFARAIRPVFTPFDGDTVFVVSTAQKPLPAPEALSLARLGELAASTLARAIARGVFEAK